VVDVDELVLLDGLVVVDDEVDGVLIVDDEVEESVLDGLVEGVVVDCVVDVLVSGAGGVGC